MNWITLPRYSLYMAKTIQIRNVPDPTYRVLAKRAKQEGISVSEYVRGLVVKDGKRPTNEEIFARIQSREPVLGDFSAADIIREAREERGRHLASLFDQSRTSPVK